MPAANPPTVDAHAALVAWMRLTALNIARNAIVADARRARRESAHGTAGRDERADSEPLASLLSRVDAEEAELLRLRHVEGMRIAAIARMLGASPRAVESALRRIVARIRTGGAS